jgi:hypothetical protein
MTHAIQWQCHRNFRRLELHEKRDDLGGFSEGSGFFRAACWSKKQQFLNKQIPPKCALSEHADGLIFNIIRVVKTGVLAYGRSVHCCPSRWL